MSERASNGIPWWGLELVRRIGKIEDTKPDVLVERIDNLTKEVKGLKTAFYLLLLGVVGSSITYAFTVFSQHGAH